MVNIYRTANMYLEPIIKEDSVSLRRGFLSTILFGVTLFIAFLSVTTFLFQQERAFQKMLTNPTLDDYLNIESEAPNCPCARPLNQVKSVPSLATFVSTQTTAVYDPTKQGTCSIIQDAFPNSNDAALSAALNATTGPDAEERQSLAVWTEDVLGSADGYCFTISNAIERIESTLGATAIGGGSLLPRSDFEDSMLAAIRSAFLSIANEYTNAGTLRVAAEAALHHNDSFRNAPHRHRPQERRCWQNPAVRRLA